MSEPHAPSNCNVMIGGATGSGKTKLSKILLSITPRALVFDPEAEYTDGAVFTDPLEVVDFWKRHVAKDWHVIFRSEDREQDLHLLGILIAWQRARRNLRPVGVWMEEASNYSRPGQLHPVIDKAYTKGRHARLSIVTVVQKWTGQIHPIIRDQSRCWIFFKMMSESSVIRERVSESEMDAILNQPLCESDAVPVRDYHYVVSPRWEDPITRWATTLRTRQ